MPGGFVGPGSATLPRVRGAANRPAREDSSALPRTLSGVGMARSRQTSLRESPRSGRAARDVLLRSNSCPSHRSGAVVCPYAGGSAAGWREPTVACSLTGNRATRTRWGENRSRGLRREADGCAQPEASTPPGTTASRSGRSVSRAAKSCLNSPSVRVHRTRGYRIRRIQSARTPSVIDRGDCLLPAIMPAGPPAGRPSCLPRTRCSSIGILCRTVFK